MKMEWPQLHLENWKETYELVHLLTQMVGKIKLQLVPFKNHWWNISFFPSVNGFTTGIIPYQYGCFGIEFDFLFHKITISLDDGKSESIELRSGTISMYYSELKEKLGNLGIEVKIWPVPVEMEIRVPFNKDNLYREYNRESIQKLQMINIRVTKILEIFRSGFKGKASPVHFFWGAFDIAVTLFSGRTAPEHPGVPNVGKKVMVEAYNAELASFGFWPGLGLGEPAFYAYTYPEPSGYKNFDIGTEGVYYNNDLREFILPYLSVTESKDPEKAILDFYNNAYRANEESASWDKSLFERRKS